MTTQIDNLVISFNEVLLHTGNLFDELIIDKTSNLLLPNNNRSSTKLNDSIKAFDDNLDKIMLQLNDISLFDAKLKQRAIEREEQKRLATDAAAQIQQPNTQQNNNNHQIQTNSPSTLNGVPNEDFSNGDNLLDDISNFLSTVPDVPDLDMGGDFNQNLNELLMETESYDNSNGVMDIDLNNFNNDGNMNGNNNGSLNGLDLDQGLFNEIDSMLNI